MIGKPNDVIRWLLEQDKEKTFEIKEHKEKRSLNANAYTWVLIGKIADAVRASKDEIYLIMLKRYGQHEVFSIRSDIDVSGYFKYWDEIGRSTLNGKEFKHIMVYKGSSQYNTKEMAVLIDGIVSEAEEMNIETLPPNEIERLKTAWNNCK